MHTNLLFSVRKSQELTWFIENPRIEETHSPRFERMKLNSITVMTPVLPKNASVFDRKEMMLNLIKDLVQDEKIENYTVSTWTCRAVPYLRYLSPDKILYSPNHFEAETHPELFLEMSEYAD